MNIQRTNIIRVMCLSLLSALTNVAVAHGGLEHVMGVVRNISPTSVTVSTTAGKTTEVGLDQKTTYAKTGHPAQLGDIKVGDRVVIHAAKNGDKLIAHTVEASAAK